MKAIISTEFGPPTVLKLQDVAKPAPQANEILVRNHATSVNYGDLVARDFKHVSASEFNMPFPLWLLSKVAFGLNAPRTTILGSEFAGEVEAVGSAVTRFKPGDQVFGYLGQAMGAYAEYFCMPEYGTVALKPANMSYEEAAVIPMGAIMALHLLREKGNIQPGDKVLIVGASGSIGAAATQLAAHHFDAEVTGVCSTARVELVKSLGAAKVVDYTREDFTKSGETYDLIFDVLGRTPFAEARKALKPGGRVLYASFKSPHLFQMLWTSVAGDEKAICAFAPGSQEDLEAVKALIEAGTLRAALDQCFPLAQTAEAHRYVESGQKAGHIAITVAPNGQGR
jgi:NADPH:quinone reductase-like Zn-dependent oxidoreductase